VSKESFSSLNHLPIKEEKMDSALKAELLGLLTDEENACLAASMAAGKKVLKITASFPINTFDKNVAELLQKLAKAEYEEIITCVPNPESSADDIAYDIILAADPQIGKIDIPGIQVEQIHP
jgi:hypothetical protein